MVLLVAGYVVTMPYWVPVKWTEDKIRSCGYSPEFPYQYELGYLMTNPEEAHGIPGPRQPFTWAARGHVDYGANFSGLDWIGGQLLVEHTYRFGDANLFVRFAQSEELQMRSGIGINFLSDRQQTDIGVNFTYAGDLVFGEAVGSVG
jgi:hypothetical protein